MATRKATVLGNIGTFDGVKEEYFFTANSIKGDRTSYYNGEEREQTVIMDEDREQASCYHG